MKTVQGYRFPAPVPYLEALALQEELLKLRINDEIEDRFLFLEHLPVITLGRRGRDNHLLLDVDVYKKRGIEIHKASRGGDVTWHGPGQLVVYPIRKLDSSHDYLSQLEEAAIQTCEAFGVSSFRKEGIAGAWTQKGKIAAIGFKLSKWVSYHGMSFNVNADLDEGFGTIVGCGLEGFEVTSLKEILGDQCPDLDQVEQQMRASLSKVFDVRIDMKNNIDDLKK